jgi:hypothetical protein
MLTRVRGAQSQIPSNYARLDKAIEDARARGMDVRGLMQKRKNLRMQELCLRDQERRLQEVIKSLQTGSSIIAWKPAE